MENDSYVFGLISMICGIVGFLCSCCGFIGGILGLILGIAAIILGVISRKKDERLKGFSIAGIICGAIACLTGIGWVIYFIFVGGMAGLSMLSSLAGSLN